MEHSECRDSGFFDIITDKQAYLSMIYLMLSFPLGILYFVYIVTGLLMGISLIPIFIGVPLLYAFMASVKYLMLFERKMAAAFLGISLVEDNGSGEKGTGILRRFKNELLDKDLWKGLTYLTTKFIMSTVIFCLCIFLAVLSLGLVAAPIVYNMLEYSLAMDGGGYLIIDGIQVNGLLHLLGISASPREEMLIFMLLGVFTGIGSMHFIKWAAYLWGGFLKLMSPARQ